MFYNVESILSEVHSCFMVVSITRVASIPVLLPERDFLTDMV